jgi:hypothetical protein
MAGTRQFDGAAVPLVAGGRGAVLTAPVGELYSRIIINTAMMTMMAARSAIMMFCFKAFPPLAFC